MKVFDYSFNEYNVKVTYFLQFLRHVVYSGRFLFLIIIISRSESRNRLVVRTLRCGCNVPGSNPGHGRTFFAWFNLTLLFYLHKVIGFVPYRHIF